MPYEIDRPHKIVSSPFCGPDSARRYTVLGSAKQMTAGRFIPRDTIDTAISPSAIRFMRVRLTFILAAAPRSLVRRTRANIRRRDCKACDLIPRR